ncbi:hypothetical protein [Succinivibrio dextrinosolvens]|uniref:hypothetical protein n=1 Tax=Succinivibrio dextrinosolvens TaxID=83771 RepID=UPI0013E92D40|nr:hypothetical protein [Succinivibrio dextrinosolvens]
MSENLKISSPVTQETSNQEEFSNTNSNQSSEHFVFNDPLPWDNGSNTEPYIEGLPDPECDPVADYLEGEPQSYRAADDLYEEKPKFYYVDALKDTHAVELATAIKRLDHIRDKYYRINSTLKKKTRLVYLVEHLNSYETKELLEFSEDYLNSLDNLNYEIRIFANRIDEVVRLLRLIDDGAEKIKEIEGKMNLTYVSDKNYNLRMEQYTD